MYQIDLKEGFLGAYDNQGKLLAGIARWTPSHHPADISATAHVVRFFSEENALAYVEREGLDILKAGPKTTYTMGAFGVITVRQAGVEIALMEPQFPWNHYRVWYGYQQEAYRDFATGGEAKRWINAKGGRLVEQATRPLSLDAQALCQGILIEALRQPGLGQIEALRIHCTDPLIERAADGDFEALVQVLADVEVPLTAREEG